MEISVLFVILITVATLLYLYIKKRFYSYWKDRNVIQLDPVMFYGNFKQVLSREIPLTDVMDEIYAKIKSKGKKYGGIYSIFLPMFVPTDLDLIKQIVLTDFSCFPNRGLYVNPKKDPLTGNLVNLEDEKWRNLRTKLTPAFSTGKMKMMFQTLVACTTGLEKLLKVEANKHDGIDIKDILTRYTTDIIGSVGFGLDANSMENADSEFRKHGIKVFDLNERESQYFFFLMFLPRWLAKLLNVKTINPQTESFFINLVKDTVSYREQNSIYRKDFLHLLIQLKNFGKVFENDDARLLNKNSVHAQGLTLEEIAAQCFVFFAAGFETSSSATTYALLELAQHQDIQDKLREEINRVLEKYDNEITYEGIAEMVYLEKTVQETLRKHPPIAILPRTCNKPYKVPNSDVIIEVGTIVSIPILSIHRDPNYYPDPDKFEPERFSEENKAKRHPMAYIPFGEGPRNCIGLKLGKLQTKVALCCILKNYRVTLHEKTQLPIKLKMSLVTSVKGGVWVNLEQLF